MYGEYELYRVLLAGKIRREQTRLGEISQKYGARSDVQDWARLGEIWAIAQISANLAASLSKIGQKYGARSGEIWTNNRLL